MADYRVGCGALGIYAGILDKTGQKWKTKSDVTDEAIYAVAQHLLQENESLLFNYHGKRYKLSVTEIMEGENHDNNNK